MADEADGVGSPRSCVPPARPESLATPPCAGWHLIGMRQTGR